MTNRIIWPILLGNMKGIELLVAMLLIGFITVGMYAYTTTANLDKWGQFEPLMGSAPLLFAVVSTGGFLVYAFVRRGR